MIKQRLVSVLMTAYNREEYIAEAIESVLASTFTDFELIIVDDCSTDNSVKIAQSYEASDSRVKVYVNEKNLGDYPNRNRAASYASGIYLKYVDSDDTIFPHALDVMVSAMDKNPEATLAISSRYHDKPPEGEYYLLSPDKAYKSHFFEFGFLDNGPSFTIIRRLAFEAFGGFGLKRNVSDFEMWLKMAAKNKVLLLSPKLVQWRQHEGQEFLIAPECYLEHQYSILKKALSPANSPLTEIESKAILAKHKKITVKAIVKSGFKKRDIKYFNKLMKVNGLVLSDLFVLLK